jgi:hypothetical protein
MNIETDKNYCIQGHVTKCQIECKEMPFFINNSGDIAFREATNVVMDVFGNTHKYSLEIVKGLNAAYKMGYEMDRVEWK